MTRFWFKLILPVLLPLVLVITAIRSIPYDDSELRSFLTPSDGCSAPCFMGIQPGLTTVDQAIDILKMQQWIAEVDESRLIQNDQYVEWTWNGSQPAFVTGRSQPFLFGPLGGRVTSINIPVTIPMVEMWWLYGQPFTQRSCTAYCTGIWYFFAYPESGILLTTAAQANCASLLKALLAGDNHLQVRSVTGMSRNTKDFLGFDLIPFESFNNRKSC